MTEAEFDRLYRLVRESARSHSVKPKALPDESIRACLDGQATEDQFEELQQALLDSEPFRVEFRDLCRDYFAMRDVLGDPVFRQTETILPNSLRSKIAQEYGDKPDNVESSRTDFRGLLHRFASHRLFQLAAAGTLAIAVFLLSRTPLLISPQWTAEAEAIPRNEVVSINVRGAYDGLEFDDEREAALYGIRSVTLYDLDAQRLIPVDDSVPGVLEDWFGGADEIVLQDPSGVELGSIWIDTDNLPEKPASQAKLWWLDVVSMSLRQGQLLRLDGVIEVPSQVGDGAAFVITGWASGKCYVLGATVIESED